MVDCSGAALLSPDLAGDACRFVLLEAAWLVCAAARGGEDEETRRAFAVIPEWVVRDMAAWSGGGASFTLA